MTQRNESIGLNPDKLDENKIDEQVYRFVAKKQMDGAPAEQAPVPKGTVGKANALRRNILQLSLAPDIFHQIHIKEKYRIG
jgi:hypothetical protein